MPILHKKKIVTLSDVEGFTQFLSWFDFAHHDYNGQNAPPPNERDSFLFSRSNSEIVTVPVERLFVATLHHRYDLLCFQRVATWKHQSRITNAFESSFTSCGCCGKTRAKRSPIDRMTAQSASPAVPLFIVSVNCVHNSSRAA